MNKKQIIYDRDTCVCCGAVIPEGQMVCDNCRDKVGLGNDANALKGYASKPPKQKELTNRNKKNQE